MGCGYLLQNKSSVDIEFYLIIRDENKLDLVLFYHQAVAERTL